MNQNKNAIISLATALVGVGGIFIKEQLDNYLDKQERIKQIPLAIKSEEATELYPTNDDFPNLPETQNLRDVSPEHKATMDAFLSKAVETGIVSKSFDGLLTCNVSVDGLAKSSNGLLRGYVTENGRIVKQAEFKPVDIPPPFMAFQIASLITGQYYQQVITQRLDKLDKEVVSIKQMLDSQDMAIRDTIKQNLSEIIALAQIDGLEDFIRINSIRNDAMKLRNKYRNLFLNIDIDVQDFYMFYKERELNAWVNKVKESNILNYMLMAIEAEYLYILCTLLLCVCHVKRNENSKAAYLLNHLEINMSSIYACHYHKIKCLVLGNTKQLLEKANYWKDSCNKSYQELEDVFVNVESLFRKTQASLLRQACLKIENGVIKKIMI